MDSSENRGVGDVLLFSTIVFRISMVAVQTRIPMNQFPSVLRYQLTPTNDIDP